MVYPVLLCASGLVGRGLGRRRGTVPSRASVPAVGLALTLMVAGGGLVADVYLSPGRSAAAADVDESTRILALLNAARSERGEAPLDPAGDLAQDALVHADRMATTATLFHQPDLGAGVCCWTRVGENVGMGSNADAIAAALMNSDTHRANILGDWSDVGIGAVVDANGVLWVAQVFRLRAPAAVAGTAPDPAPAPAPASAARPGTDSRAGRSAVRPTAAQGAAADKAVATKAAPQQAAAKKAAAKKAAAERAVAKNKALAKKKALARKKAAARRAAARRAAARKPPPRLSRTLALGSGGPQGPAAGPVTSDAASWSLTERLVTGQVVSTGAGVRTGDAA